MMKKLFAVIMMLLTILSLAACGSTEKQTGFYITLPDAIGSSDKRIYRAMNDEMLEVVYVNGEDETGRVRKARGHK